MAESVNGRRKKQSTWTPLIWEMWRGVNLVVSPSRVGALGAPSIYRQGHGLFISIYMYTFIYRGGWYICFNSSVRSSFLFLFYSSVSSIYLTSRSGFFLEMYWKHFHAHPHWILLWIRGAILQILQVAPFITCQSYQGLRHHHLLSKPFNIIKPDAQPQHWLPYQVKWYTGKLYILI